LLEKAGTQDNNRCIKRPQVRNRKQKEVQQRARLWLL